MSKYPNTYVKKETLIALAGEDRLVDLLIKKYPDARELAKMVLNNMSSKDIQELVK